MRIEVGFAPWSDYPVTHKPILFGLFVQSVFFAELAIFIELDTIRIVLFVFVGLVISLFALSASQSNQVTHLVTPRLRTDSSHRP